MVRPRLLAALTSVCLIACCGCHQNARHADGSGEPRSLQPQVQVDRPSPDAVNLALQQHTPLGDEFAAVDAANDKWESETFHDRIKKQFTVLGQWLKGDDQATDRSLAGVVDEQFACSSLRPEPLKEVYTDGVVSVMRAANSAQASDLPHQPQYSGPRGAVEALHALLVRPSDASDVHFAAKIFRVDLTTPSAQTSAYVTFSWRSEGQSSQQNMVWHCSWRRAVGHAPQLLSIRSEDYEQVVSRSASPLMIDCTASALAANRCYREQFAHGLNHWCGRLEARMGVYIRGLAGLAVGDVNGDGLDDLYVCEPGGLPNRLFVQQPDGSARDVSSECGADLMEPSRAALFADLDNDGHQDLVVIAVYSVAVIFRGEGGGRFRLIRSIPVRGTAYSIAAADVNEDRLLDLYVCSYTDVPGEIGEGGQGVPEPYYDANNGSPNVLLENVGDLQFRDVTQDCGLNTNNRRYSYAAVWEDFDNDGDLDLYVANDFGRNNLFRNDFGRFTDIAAEAGVEDIASGMSASCGDYDNDGHMDIYVSNMWSSAGGRITFQPDFPGGDTGAKHWMQRLARGNTLYRNRGDGTFEDRSISANVTMGRWAWGSNSLDLNNDGWEDLLVANGFVTGQEKDDL